jgi:hypothetical protein
MTDRPLGRGLADISYLFLSQRPEETTARAPASDGAPARVFSGPESGILALRPGPSIARDRLGLAVRELAGALEEGMKGIDAGVPCDGDAVIDVIALDRANQLTVIDIEANADDGLLLRGMAHVDWAARNMPTLRRLYSGRPHILNASDQPRLVLVAPRFSPLLLSVVRQLAHVPVSCVTYHVADVFGRPAILFAPVG